MKIKKMPLGIIGFLQALGVAIYCGGVGLLFWQGGKLFGQVPSFWGPFLFLVLFSASILVCGLLALGYPVILFWKKDQKIESVKLVAYTTGWLLLFVLGIITSVALF